MSDFLTRLATRSSGTVGTVRPRLASRFEPTAAPGPGAAAAGSRDGEPGTASADPRLVWDETELRSVRAATPLAAEPPPVDPMRRPRPRPLAPDPDTRYAADPSAPPAADLAAPAVAPRDQPGPAPARRAPQPPGQPPRDPSPERTEPGAARDAPGAPVRAPAVASQDLAETAREPRPRVHVPATPRAAPLPARDATVPRSPLLVPDQERAVRPPLPAVAHATLPAAMAGVRPGAARGSSQAPAEPAIHVTIGRIEVRTSSTPAAPPNGRTSSPIVGLDEYLKRRTGGGGPG
jgi:hypothetical protein